jgi:hypothetical protein
MTLFFVLGQNFLEVYAQKYEFEGLIEDIRSYDQILELSSKFESLWQKLYPDYIQNATKLALILQNRSGFTDTRVVSMWCRTKCMFDANCTFEVLTQEQYENLGENLENNLKNNIQYSQAPKIGVK